MRKQRRATAAVTVAVLALVGLLSGCGGSGGSGTNQQPLKPVANSGSGPMKDGGTLVYGQTAGVSQLDPNVISSGAQTMLQTLLWNGLTKINPDSSVGPDLATSWESTPDYLHWTFHLHPGVTYHNGRAFTATDAAQNIERVLDPTTGSQTRPRIEMISSVRATDPNTLAIDLKTPNPQLPLALVNVKMTDVPDIANVSKDANGTGPYQLKSFTPDQTVDLVRNEHYFGTKPHFDEIKVVRYADATAAETALRSGAINVLWSVSPTSAAGLATDGRKLLAATDPASAFVWELDTTSPPFNNPKARLALSYAADRVSMMQAGYAGFGVVSKSDEIVSPSNKYYNKKLPTDAYDLNKAKQLFAEAGIHSGDTLTYWTTSGSYTEWTTMGEILQQSLGQIGIKLNIQANEIATWSAKSYPKGKKYPGLIFANYISLAPPLPNTYPLEWFSSSGTCECNWVPPAKYDADEQTIEQQGDGPARTAAFDEMQQILHDQAPVIVVGNTSFLSVTGANVRGVWVESEGTLHLEDAGFAA